MRILLTLCACLITGGVFGQKLDHRLGYMIIRVEHPRHLNAITHEYTSRLGSAIKIERSLSERMGIYLISFNHAIIHERKFLADLRADDKIMNAQFDHLTTNRNQPNDPMFDDQWQWLNTGQTGGMLDGDIDADLAWDITTGGLTALGDTIVVAIIDDGLDYNHEDISANVWVNHEEIPDNGIDDDDNGYKDDYYGWNVYSDSSNVFRRGHGLSVAGMVGAVGNNGVGITGLNWNVKLMTVVGGSPESFAIAAYAYVLEQRILYNETQGQRGAFVVATNSSWGIDFGQPADAPLWCAFYDFLGEHGILSAAATSNIGYDVDSLGDLPTGCQSEYLLSVTALDHNKERSFSAFGLHDVDFGAPGDNIFTTQGENGYGHTSGTSFASPTAAGLVALLYSAPCESMAELARSHPSVAAQFVRDLIFRGVDKLPELEDEIRFGGSLNAGNSLQLVTSICSSCPSPIGVTIDVLTDEEVNIEWVPLDTVDGTNIRYRPLFATEWDTLLDVSSPYILDDLLGCTEYIIEFESVCGDSTSGFLTSAEFETEGCCELPSEITASANATSVNLTWSSVFAAEYYLIQWRLEGQADWIEEVTSLNEVSIENLEPCTTYEFRLQTNCDTSSTGFSDIISIRTRECGNCLDLSYCEAGSEDATEEFIDSLVIGPLVSHSGFNNGYMLFENLNPEYGAGETYSVQIRPGFEFGSTFDEQFRIWLDANQDGVFDFEELLLDTVLSQDDTILIDDITIPVDALAGNTRMRVSMSFFDPPFDVDQDPCGLLEFGEVEDYCVTIIRNENNCPEVDTVQFDGITFTSAFMFWPGAEGAIAYTYRYREAGELEFMELATTDTSAVLTGLSKCTMYEVQIRTVCFSDTTAYDTTYILETDCDVAVEEINPLLISFDIFPNPATENVTIRFHAAEHGEHSIGIYTVQGQKIFDQNIFADKNASVQIQVSDLARYPPGLYFVVIENRGKIATEKLVKI